LKTDYQAHDKAYEHFRKQGQPGWAKDYDQDFLALERVLTSEHVPKAGKVLELGCGAGNIAIWLAQKGYEVCGVEISPTAVEWAQENAAKDNVCVDVRVGDVLDLADFPDEEFDFVLDGHCFHCIIGKDRERFLASAWRVLKPQSLFLARTMCGDIRSKEMKKLYDPESRCVVRAGVAIRYLGEPKTIVQEIEDAGFHILRWYVIPPQDEEDQDDLIVEATKC
jgi:SAM-dependent methyltransferase